MASRQSHGSDARPLSPPISTSPSAADRGSSLSASSMTIQPSLEHLNDYVRKHYERFIEHESLERSRLAASFAEKEQSYEKQISTLKAIHIDISGLLAREQSTNSELRRQLDIATDSMSRLCKVVADNNFVSVHHKQGPHGIKQEDSVQESLNVSDSVCSNVVISSTLSQTVSTVTEMNAPNGVVLSSPSDPLPGHSIIETFGKVADSLLATQRSFALLLENFKSADAARVDIETQNQSLQEKIALLQEELRQTRGDNEKISRELAAARQEREKHICHPPLPGYPTPAAQDDLPVPLPSPPLERRDLPIPADILQDTGKIRRNPNQTPEKRLIPENAITPPLTPTTQAGPSSASASMSGRRRRISINEAFNRVKANSVSSTTKSGPPEAPIIRDDEQTAGQSMPPPSTPVRGVKRTSSDVHKCQNAPPPTLTPSTSASTTSPISDKTNNRRPQKKRRINCASGASLKNKLTNENPAANASATHTSTSTTYPPSASSSRHNMVPLPKTSASDLKSLKFNKTSQSSKALSAPALATSSNINTPTKSSRPSMKPLDLAKKSPQERAALRKAK